MKPQRAADTLCYPRNALVLVAGLPGAGKTTLLNRLYRLEGTETTTVRSSQGVWVIDSQQSRNRLTLWLRWLPYPVWRWVVHVLHYVCVILALRTGDPVVVHETGTCWLVRRLLGWYCRRLGVEVHLMLINVSPEEALRSQIRRGRRVSGRNHRVHARRWRRLLADCAVGPSAVLPGAESLVLLDRKQAGRLAGIDFSVLQLRPVRGDDGQPLSSA